MNVRDLAAQHNALAARFMLYEQRAGQLPPVEVLNELRYALRVAVEFIMLCTASPQTSTKSLIPHSILQTNSSSPDTGHRHHCRRLAFG